MKRSLAPSIFLLLALAGAPSFAARKFVEIKNEPASELCASASQAVKDLRKDAWGTLRGLFRDPQTRAASDIQAHGLSFYTLRTKTLRTVDSQSVERETHPAYYVLDIDNNGSQEMIELVSGGHGAAGDGDTLSIYKDDPSTAAQPIPNETFMHPVLELGRGVSFFGSKKRFTPAYYLYPFNFKTKSYLLLEGNRHDDPMYLVIEISPDKEIVTHCSF